MFFGWVVLWLLAKKSSLKLQDKLLYFSLGTAFGVLIEFLQSSMHLGRSFEFDDIIADTVGVLIGVLLIDLIVRNMPLFKKYIPFIKYLYPHH